MIPIAIVPLVTADQLSCWLATADGHACPECASTPRNDHSFVCAFQSTRLISAITCTLGPPRHSARDPQPAPAAPSAPAKSPIAPAEPGAPLPALSFLGGFRTTAPVLVASSEMGRHPKPVT